MPEPGALDLPENPRLAANIAHFARALRKAGVPIGPGSVIDALRAVSAVGFTDRQDFYWVLHACFVRHPAHRPVFAQVFRLFWRDPRFLEHMMAQMLPAIRGVQEDRVVRPAERRAAEALLEGVERPEMPQQQPGADEIEIAVDATGTASDRERLRSLDFEQMSADEMAQARAMIARLALPVRPLPSRRFAPALRGRRVDWPRSLRAAMRQGGEIGRLLPMARQQRWPDLIALCDISGSMSAYSRVVLHFLHSVALRQGPGWARVHAFTFGTRLTNISRHLRTREVDAALAAAGAEARDWEGGTRIGASLAAFNRDWSRRLMGRGAVVLLITDGLDRGAPEDLAAAARRLHLSARRVIWINPLLRWDGFAPRAAGIRALLPHVDCLRTGHNIASLADLARVVAQARDEGEKPRLMAALREA